MKIAFLGQAEISKIVLEKLHNSRHEVVCVVTNVDKEIGRGKKMTFSPVKLFALANNIPILQYKSISRQGYEEVKSHNPDVLVTASFGQILKKNILEIAPHGVVNLHPSLLPKYRGAAPINWAIVKGEKTTGVTIMKTAEGIDNGDIILQEPVDILPDETSTELGVRLFEMGSELLLKALDQIENGTETYTKQDENKATFFPKLTKEMGKLDFDKTAQDIQNQTNGLYSLCFVEVKKETDQEVLKVYKAKPINLNIDTTPYEIGQVVASNPKQGLVVKCKDGLVLLDVIQAAGGKVMPSKNYLNGKKISLGTQF